MSLELDQRQRAIFAEMGIRVWQPIAQAQPQPQEDHPVLSAATRTVARVAPVPAAVPQPVNPAVKAQAAEVASMDWAALEQAVEGVLGVGDRQADWMVVGEAEVLQGEVGNEGLLLDNMLKALGLNRRGMGSSAVYVTNVLKSSGQEGRQTQTQVGLSAESCLRRQVALVQPKIILALGRVAAQLLLTESLPEVAHTPLGKLRGQLHHHQGIPVVVTYAPSSLLRSPQDKAKAWADLCLALDLLQRSQ